MKTLQLTILVFILTTYSYSQSNSWNGITPLKSTRTDVEKILGTPESKSKGDSSDYFKTKDARIFVLYSTGNCDITPSNGWNIPKGKVISISVEPFIPLKFTTYKFDKTLYKKRSTGDYLDSILYVNEKDGVRFTVNTLFNEIDDFTYFPKSTDDYLLCK